jgi:hypothetical protein
MSGDVWLYAAIILWLLTCGYLAYLHQQDKKAEA